VTFLGLNLEMPMSSDVVRLRPMSSDCEGAEFFEHSPSALIHFDFGHCLTVCGLTPRD